MKEFFLLQQLFSGDPFFLCLTFHSWDWKETHRKTPASYAE